MYKFKTFDPGIANENRPFDPAYSYDGLGDYSRNANLAQIDISIVNAQATDVTVELFNFMRSCTKIYNPSISALNPATVENLITLTGSNPKALDLNSLIYFDKSGSLIYQNASGAKCTVSANQLPYRVLFESSGFTPFRVETMRLTVTNDSQIDKQFTHVKQTWLGGKIENTISPRSYLNPTQFQSKTIDIAARFNIDLETGLWYTVKAGETVSINFFINEYVKNTLSGN